MRSNALVAAMILPMMFASQLAQAVTCGPAISARSGVTSATILELYTSEGCDSCPPADKWFSTLNFARDGVVPLAFHVDYWDYIGWKDRFAKSLFTQRQREAVTRQGGRVSYTPQLMLDGRDLRIWSHQAQFQARVKEVANRPPRAGMVLEAVAGSNTIDASLTANVALAADRADAVVFIAVTENNLSSRITAGENRGVHLKHDHVVRELIGPIAVDAQDRAAGKFNLRRTIMLSSDWKRGDLSLVAFLQNSRNGEVLQALSAPLCRG